MSLILCAALVVGNGMPEYGMSVHAAETIPYSAEADSSMEDNIEENTELSVTAMEKSLTVTMAKTEYEAGSEIKPEDLTVEYRGADGEVTVLPYKNGDKGDGTGDGAGDGAGDDTGDDSVTGYTMSGADTNTPGVKTLTVSYDDGTDMLTATADYTVYGFLTEAMVTMPDREYIYNREEQKPEPVVKYADDVTLKPGEDYSVAYTDNIDAGEAALTVTGKGVYRGSVTKKFIIKKATFGVVELSCEASCWKAAQGYLDLRGYFSVEADLDGGGFTGRSIGEIEEYDNVEDGGDDVLAEQPYIDENGLLRYSTKAGAVGDSVMIPIIVSFGKNYNDGVICFTISLQDDGSASGTYEGVTWKIDADGKLTVEGTGEFSNSSGMNRAPWYYYRDRIKSAEIRVTGMRNASYMFYQCRNLTSVDLSGFDTCSVTNMESMFSGCTKLASLDLSNFDTGSVTEIKNMFAGCQGLTSLKLGSFDTGKATDMSGMFYNCASLTSLDLSSFDTGKVTDMSSMFYQCRNLTSVDLSGFDTCNVTNLYAMFYECGSLTSLDLSSFDMSSVTKANNMFFHCSSLSTLYTPYHIPADAVPALPVMQNANDKWYDSEQKEYTELPAGLDYSIALARNKTPDATEKRLSVILSKCEYEQGSVIQPEDLTVQYRGTDGRTICLPMKDGNNAFGYIISGADMASPAVRTLTVSYDDGTDTLTKTVNYMVYGVLTDSMVSMPDKEYIYNREEQKPEPVVSYTGDAALKPGEDYSVSYADNIDAGEAVVSVSGKGLYRGTVTKKFVIQKATFDEVDLSCEESCWKPAQGFLDLRDYFAVEAASDGGGFAGRSIGEIIEYNTVSGRAVLSQLPSIDADGILRYSTIEGTAGDSVLIPVIVSFGKNYNDAVINVTITLCDEGEVSGTYEGITWTIASSGKLTVKGTGEFSASKGWDRAPWYSYRKSITSAEVRVTGMKNASDMFIDCWYLKSVDLSGFDTSSVTNMNGMFGNCSSLKSVDLSGFDTSSVTNMGYLFGGCSSLTSLDLRSFDMSGVTAMENMLDGCSGLAKIYTPYNIPTDTAPLLPVRENDKWYDSEQKTYTALPVGLDHSIVLAKNRTPDAAENPSNPTDPTDPDDSGFPDDGKFRISKVPNQLYTGKAIKPAVVVYYGSRRLTEKADYTVAYKNNINANDAKVAKTAPTITVKGKGNYSGKQSITFVIEPRSIEGDDVTAIELAAAANGKVQKPIPNLLINIDNKDKKLRNKKDFIVSYPDAEQAGAYKEAGTYTVTVVGTKNYWGTRNIKFTVTDKIPLSKAKITVKAKEYTGSAVKLGAEDITVRVGKTTLTYGTDYTLSYRNNTQVGKAAVIVTGAGDTYAGSKEAAFHINGISLAKAQISGISEKTYTGAELTQDIRVELNGKTLNKGSDYTVSYTRAVNAGKAAVVIRGMGGYTGSVKKTFKITPYDLGADEAHKLSGVPAKLRIAYAKGGAAPELALTFDGKPLTAKTDYTVTYKNNKKPAEAAGDKAPVMIVRGKGNFKGTFTIPFAITVNNLEADNQVTITAADTAYVNKAGKYAVKPVLTDANGKKLAAGTDYEKTFTYRLLHADGRETELTTADIVPAGSRVKVTVTGKGSYAGSLSATYRITQTSFSKAKITIKPKAYTGGAVTLSEEDIKVTLGGKTLTYGEDYTVVEDSYQNNTKKGRATVTVKGLNNYGGSKTVKFKIMARMLTEFLKVNISTFMQKMLIPFVD